jgi:hypothetical protein
MNLFLAAIFALAIHEAGHYFTAEALNVRTWGIYVGWRGVGVRLDNSIVSDPIRWGLIAASGPMANLLTVSALVVAQVRGLPTPVEFVACQLAILLASMASDGRRVWRLAVGA